jgi:DNA-binding beta-propeller fold protein YncE
MPETFECPHCGAPLHHSGGSEKSMRCPFCNSSVIVPESLRERPAPPPIQFQYQPPIMPRRTVSSRGLLLIILIPLITICLCVMSSFFSITHRLFNANRTETGRYSGGPSNKLNEADTNIALKFGSEGTGPGFFTDARSIALDGAGHIYVGDYTGGRIQVFDAQGKFITQWSIGDRKTILRGLAGDRRGNVYVVQGGNIYRYEGTTGALLGQIQYAGGWGFDDCTATPDGGLIAAWYKNRDDIVRFDNRGQTVRTVRAAISSTSGDSELNTRVAADGAGNIYALGTFNNAVFKFTSDGRYVNRFGSAGEQPGQFRAPSSIAADNQGRVYVSDIKGIQIFDADGRYLGTIKTGSPVFGMVFNDKNELFVAARTQVLKLIVNKR